MREAMQITGAALGKDHPDYATRLNNLAVLFAHQGRWADALPMAEKALAIWQAALGDQHPDVENARQSLAAMRAAAEK